VFVTLCYQPRQTPPFLDNAAPSSRIEIFGDMVRPGSKRHFHTISQRRARLYNVSTNDPMLLRPRPGLERSATKPIAYSKNNVEAETVQRPRTDLFSMERWYAGCAKIPPGSFTAACERYGGEGAAAVALRTADVGARTAGFDVGSYTDLVDEWTPSMHAKPTEYTAGPSTPYTLRSWPVETRYPAGCACILGV